MNVEELSSALARTFSSELLSNVVSYKEVTIEVSADKLLAVMQTLRDDPVFQFEQMIDLCGVDYSTYGNVEWETQSVTSTGFSRAVEPSTGARLHFGDEQEYRNHDRPRFATVYHLLSLHYNHRLRVRVYCDDESLPVVPSVDAIWPSANWFEREAFDLFGIVFEGHPDLRRILTDYGFVGHPFRKDFPLIGHVEMKYDEQQKRVIYQPVSIEPRVLVPRVIRDDARYETVADQNEAGAGESDNA